MPLIVFRAGLCVYGVWYVLCEKCVFIRGVVCVVCVYVAWLTPHDKKNLIYSFNNMQRILGGLGY